MLADLDELILKCPDPRSRAYVAEAVTCYKNGAYRSAIVSTWIALAFDLIDKIRFLAAAGDAEAKKNIDHFDKISAVGDIAAALQFEKGLLDLAKDKLELISHAEHLDLKRIAEDRNRCAHPSHTMGTATFEPPSELARLHIVNAVTIVLMQQPAQGKAALDRLLKDLKSAGFPSKQDEMLTYLKSGPIAKPRRSLLRNFVIVLIKSILDVNNDFKYRHRAEEVLKCVVKLHPADAGADLEASLNSILAHADDALLLEAVTRLSDARYWNLLAEAQRIRLKARVEQLPDDAIDTTETLIGTPLEESANSRLKHANVNAIIDGDWFASLPGAAIERLLSAYQTSPNWATANRIGKFLREKCTSMSPGHMNAVVHAAAQNDEVKHSIEFPKLLQALAGRNDAWKAAVNASLAGHALDEFAIQ